MADSKKYDGSQWEHSLRKMTTATAEIESTIYTDGTAITSYTIKGNTVQSGTPTPSNPVDVNGVGVRTENIYDKYSVLEVANLGTRYGQYVPEGVYSIYNDTDNTVYWGVQDMQSRFKACEPHSTATVDMSVEHGSLNYGFMMPYNDASLGDITIVQGSTPPDHYIPYGYKIPISNGQQTTNIYLGSTQTVRAIKKVVFDGSENWQGADNTASKYLDIWNYDYYKVESGVTCMSTHYSGANNIVSGDSIPNNSACFYKAKSPRLLYLKGSEPITLADFKAYLAQQYANGAPVTVWYVLATAETAAVNEPLMKIGDYADTLSNAASIPTTEGANSITVDTTVQPNEFTATWTGWHNANVKEWDGSDWQ